jgi:hypothetical protein
MNCPMRRAAKRFKMQMLPVVFSELCCPRARCPALWTKTFTLQVSMRIFSLRSAVCLLFLSSVLNLCITLSHSRSSPSGGPATANFLLSITMDVIDACKRMLPHKWQQVKEAINQPPYTFFSSATLEDIKRADSLCLNLKKLKTTDTMCV